MKNINRIKNLIVLFFVLLIILPIPAFAQSAKEAVRALKKLEARCQAGINYRDYVRELGDAKFEVNLFLEGDESKSKPRLAELVSEIMEIYERARDFWSISIRTHYPPDEVLNVDWGLASEYLKQATTLLSKSASTQESPESETVINLNNNPSKGDKNAKVIIIEFSDYQCPFCGRYVRETLPEIEKEYIATGKVKYVFLDYPLPFHKNASKAAEAAHCAGEQGKYWEMHNELFANQNALDPKNLSEYANKIELDIPKFEQCFDTGKYAEEIKNDINEAKKAGVTGSPNFLIGHTEPDKPEIIKDIKMIRGAQPYSKFKETINELLSSQK